MAGLLGSDEEYGGAPVRRPAHLVHPLVEPVETSGPTMAGFLAATTSTAAVRYGVWLASCIPVVEPVETSGPTMVGFLAATKSTAHLGG
jgi:hypothetical protein